MKRVRHSDVAFGTTAAAIMSVITANLSTRPPKDPAQRLAKAAIDTGHALFSRRLSNTIGRIIADGISRNIRQPVVVENVAGAGGMVGGSRVAKATPDGYQFIIGTVGPTPRASGSTRRHFKCLDGFRAGGAPYGQIPCVGRAQRLPRRQLGAVLRLREGQPGEVAVQLIGSRRLKSSCMHAA